MVGIGDNDYRSTLSYRDMEIERSVRRSAALGIASFVLSHGDGSTHDEILAEISELLEACGLAGPGAWQWWDSEKVKPLVE